MRALITGGSGFIGAEIARILVGRGDEVALFRRSSSTQRIADIADRARLLQGDVGNFNHVLDAVNAVKPDIIYHLGAMLSVPSEADPSTSIQTNAMGTFYVLEAARMFDVPQVLFSSSIATFGGGVEGGVLRDNSLQRPSLLYGAAKLFGEHLGLFFKRKYGLDYRGIRYPSVVGPGVRSPGVVQYTSWVIEECAKGKPFTVFVKPETRCPIVYYKDAALGTVRLMDAPIEAIRTVNYLIDGVPPTPTAKELADAVKARLPQAQIDFQPNPEIQPILDRALLPIDDTNAHEEWDWTPEYDLDRMMDDFLRELTEHPERYA